MAAVVISSRRLVRRLPIQYLSRIVVHPLLDGGYPLFAHLGKIRPLGKETPYHAVVVLYAAFLPRRVTVAVPHLEPAAAVDAPAEFVILQKLAAVVRGQGLKAFGEVRQLLFPLIEDPSDGGRLPVWQFAYDLLSAVSFRQRQQHRPALGLPDDQIHLPVSWFRALANVCRSLLYARQFRMRHSGQSVPGLGFPLSLLP